MSSGSISDHSADPSNNLVIFQDARNRLELICKRYFEIERLQDGMNVVVVSREIIDDMQEDLESNHTLWKIVFTIEQLVLNFTQSLFMVNTFFDIYILQIQTRFSFFPAFFDYRMQIVRD